MSKKSYKEIILSLEKENYKFNYFNTETVGEYLPEDADWNYKDIEHPKLVHSGFSAIQTFASEDIACSINLQKIPFLGISLPLLIVNYEYTKFNQTYYTSFGPYIIFISTIIEKKDSDQTLVRTRYAVGSKSIFRIFHKLIGKILLKNYKTLMSEDLPMRNRKGLLRKIGHSFYSPKDTYPFNYSEQLNKSNVYLNKNTTNEITIDKNNFLLSKEGDMLGQKLGVLSFFVTENNEKKEIWPTTCSHEGANLNKKCIKGERIYCPWHNKVTAPLLSIKKDKIEIKNNSDYSILEEKNSFKIKYKNIQ